MIVREVAPLSVGQAAHSAFPGLCLMPNGEVHLVYRQGSNHYAARDGVLRGAVSYDGGRTFTDDTHLRVTPGVDYRDPYIFWARGLPHFTWFTATATLAAAGANDQRQRGPDVRVDGGLPYAAISGPTIELPDGRLGCAFYGRKAGESVDTAWMAWTVDHGLHWTTNRIANGIAVGRAYNEPFLVRAGDDVHMFFRSGSSAIGMRSTSDSGRTWGPVRDVLSSATGRPSAFYTSTGLLVVVYRDTASRSAELAWSSDNGATWVQGLLLLACPVGSPNGMTYAAMVEPEPGVIRGVVGMEKADGSSSLYGFDLDPT